MLRGKKCLPAHQESINTSGDEEETNKLCSEKMRIDHDLTRETNQVKFHFYKQAKLKCVLYHQFHLA